MQKLIYKIVSFITIVLSISSMVHAQQFDQAYIKWKAEQQARDARLKSSDSNYYLSKPNLETKNKTSSATAVMSNMSGKIHLNSANINELQQLNGVGEKKAQAIVEYRQQNGKFKTVAELQNVKGIGPKLLEKNKDRLSL